ncbi:MAG TPA: tetratricopeptide repeat-containing serine protease family protein, partial [Verrucomicrobiota bacterium]|nr:tetratricopeptide repeat-containing serine protease family protein [Verrucomicrobiota bacterium]
QGDADAQGWLGVMYVLGEGVLKDAVEAVKWLRKAADQGQADAQWLLGDMYADGKGVPKDAAEAVKWYRKAANQGHANAQNDLGFMYANGKGVPKDAAEAVKWFRQAANQGHAWAQYHLGRRYAQGEGVSKDIAEAVKWFRQAADQGHAWAQYRLGLSYARSEGVPKDATEAVKWYRRAADQGHWPAQCSLGAMYAQGTGVPKDAVEAYKWFNLAAAGGDPEVAKQRAALERKLSRSQIAEGQRRTRVFMEEQAAVARKGEYKIGDTPFLEDDMPKGSGTGFFITEDGFLVTNAHVVHGAAYVRLFTRAGLIPARIVKEDTANDLALLKGNGRFATLPVVPSRKVRLGSTVCTIGFPNILLQGLAPKLTKGEISALSGTGDDARFFQISVPIQPGNSGGALVDERGNVVGVVVASLKEIDTFEISGALPQNVNYAVKSSYLLGFLESVPEVASRLKAANATDQKFEDMVEAVEQATVQVLAY